MKDKTIYILAVFLIMSGSLFGFYMKKQNEQIEPSNKPIVQSKIAEERQEETQSVFVAVEEVASPAYWVQSAGEEILIYAGETKEEICRMPFAEERLYEQEKIMLARGIAARTKEEALMIAEAFVN